jgi:PAS domain S-box-containing protein
LLDVHMPELDGFETAALIKQHYVFKPFNPEVLQSKIPVFIELHEKTEALRRQAELLKEQELAELRRESEQRYRFLADAQPDQIWTANPDGALDYVNQRILDYFGATFPEIVESGWTQVVHPEDLPHTLERWQRSLDTGQPYENELRLRRAADGSYRWHLTRALPMRNREGEVVKWFGSHTEIDDRKRAEEAQRFLVDAGALLGTTLDYRSTLGAVARMAVPRIADWARVDVLEDGRLRTLAGEHVDPHKVEVALELARRYPEDPDARQGPPCVVRTGESELVRDRLP